MEESWEEINATMQYNTEFLVDRRNRIGWCKVT